MGDISDMSLSDRMSEWELARDNEFADLGTQYELGLCDEHGFQFYPGTPVVDSRPFVPKRKMKASGKGKCPLCESETHLVTGAFGEFYGCTKFPSCKGSRNKG